MASKTKSKPSKQEAEIEKCRTDGEWSKIIDISKTIKSTNIDTYVNFVVAESKLEKYLSEHPPSDKNISEAQQQLAEPEKLLNDVLHTSPPEWIQLECTLLLAKIHYVMGDYKAALSKYNEVGLDTLSVSNITNRRLKLIGEAFAVKGLCLDKVLPPSGRDVKQQHGAPYRATSVNQAFGLCIEKTPASSTSKFQLAEREEQIIKCFERSGDISLSQLQEKHKGNKTSSLTTTGGGLWSMVDLDTTGVGAIVETAIQRSPILYIRNGELSKGVGRFRELLRTCETRAIQGLRQTLARQLAEVLLRGVCRSTYEAVPPIDNNQSTITSSNKPQNFSTPSHSTTTAAVDRIPNKYYGDNLYMPKNQSEESLLLLLISESVATREAILNRSPEFTEARLHTFHNTTAVYDLLTIALVKRAQFNMLSETFERAMKFSFDEYHIWYQFALSLICAQKYGRALLVLQECIRLRPNDPVVLLQAAKLCYERVGKTDLGLEYSHQCADLEDLRFLSKAFVSLGVGYSMKADEAKLQVQRQDFQKQALNLFQRAVAVDNNDFLAEYHVALQLAQLRQIPEAMEHVRRALTLRPEHVHSLHLLILLLSAQKLNSEALNLIDAAIQEYPDDFNLHFTKSKLEEVVFGAEEALQTCRQMLILWKKKFEPTLEDSEQRGTGLIERITTSHRSLVQLQLTEFSDRDSGSIRAESMAASRVEQALSEVASSIGSTMIPRQGPMQTWNIQTQIWLHLAEMYIRLDNLESAAACIQEASNIYPFSHMVSFMRGCVHQVRGELYEAKQCFENSLSINPQHIRSLQHLGVVLHMLDNGRMAEKVLRDAVNADPTSSQNWNHLGQVLQSLEDYEAGGECMMTAVELEATNPIIPFSNLPKSLS